MFTRLQEVLGEEQATVLMEHLPPVGWADVATKHDIDALRVSTKRDLEHAVASLEQRSEILENRLLATFRAELNVQTRTMIYAMSASTVTVATLAFGAARLV